MARYGWQRRDYGEAAPKSWPRSWPRRAPRSWPRRAPHRSRRAPRSAQESTRRAPRSLESRSCRSSSGALQAPLTLRRGCIRARRCGRAPRRCCRPWGRPGGPAHGVPSGAPRAGGAPGPRRPERRGVAAARLEPQGGRRHRAPRHDARHEAVGRHLPGAEQGAGGVPVRQAVPHALAQPPGPRDQARALERGRGVRHLRGAAPAGQQVGRDREAAARAHGQRYQEPLVLDHAAQHAPPRARAPRGAARRRRAVLLPPAERAPARRRPRGPHAPPPDRRGPGRAPTGMFNSRDCYAYKGD